MSHIKQLFHSEKITRNKQFPKYHTGKLNESKNKKEYGKSDDYIMARHLKGGGTIKEKRSRIEANRAEEEKEVPTEPTIL